MFLSGLRLGLNSLPSPPPPESMWDVYHTSEKLQSWGSPIRGQVFLQTDVLRATHGTDRIAVPSNRVDRLNGEQVVFSVPASRTIKYFCPCFFLFLWW